MLQEKRQNILFDLWVGKIVKYLVTRANVKNIFLFYIIIIILL